MQKCKKIEKPYGCKEKDREYFLKNGKISVGYTRLSNGIQL